MTTMQRCYQPSSRRKPCLAMQLRDSGVRLHIAYPGMTQTAMLDAMDARTRGLIDELPAITVYPSEQACHQGSQLGSCACAELVVE